MLTVAHYIRRLLTAPSADKTMNTLQANRFQRDYRILRFRLSCIQARACAATGDISAGTPTGLVTPSVDKFDNF